MQLIGIGFDLVDVPSFKLMYGSTETDLSHVFSDDEISYSCSENDRFIHLAARFAAKEAALKALGCGMQDGISLTDIAVIRLTSGAPTLELSGGALQQADRLGVSGWLLSLTHLEAAAGAVAIAFSSGPR